MEKTFDEKIAELVAELAQVKKRLDKCEQQLEKHEHRITEAEKAPARAG